MQITIPKDVLTDLPSPDGQGLVRVSIALKMGDDGKASIVEINDTPVGGDDEDDDPSPEEAEASMPSPDDVASSILGQ